MDFLIKFTDNVEYSDNEIDTSFFDTIESNINFIAFSSSRASGSNSLTQVFFNFFVIACLLLFLKHSTIIYTNKDILYA